MTWYFGFILKDQRRLSLGDRLALNIHQQCNSVILLGIKVPTTFSDIDAHVGIETKIECLYGSILTPKMIIHKFYRRAYLCK